MSSDAGLVISGEDVERYQLDGAVLLRGVFADWVEPLREDVEHVLRSPRPLERTYRPADGSAPFFQDFCNWGLCLAPGNKISGGRVLSSKTRRSANRGRPAQDRRSEHRPD